MCVDKRNLKCLGALQTSGFVHLAAYARWVIGVGGYLSA